jgi:iron complex transport system permease protein
VASRLILTGSELPVGVITALCGAPFFLYLLMKSKKEFYR